MNDQKATLEALCLSPVVPPTARSTSRSVAPPGNRPSAPPASSRLNKFVRGLHQMLLDEKGNGIIDWDKGVLILHSLDDFSEKVLPRYFNTRNFKTFRRQLNYYGFLHLKTDGSPEGSALWVNQELAEMDDDSVGVVLRLKRVTDPSHANNQREREAGSSSSGGNASKDKRVRRRTLSGQFVVPKTLPRGIPKTVRVETKPLPEPKPQKVEVVTAQTAQPYEDVNPYDDVSFCQLESQAPALLVSMLHA